MARRLEQRNTSGMCVAYVLWSLATWKHSSHGWLKRCRSWTREPDEAPFRWVGSCRSDRDRSFSLHNVRTPTAYCTSAASAPPALALLCGQHARHSRLPFLLPPAPRDYVEAERTRDAHRYEAQLGVSRTPLGLRVPVLLLLSAPRLGLKCDATHTFRAFEGLRGWAVVDAIVGGSWTVLGVLCRRRDRPDFWKDYMPSRSDPGRVLSLEPEERRVVPRRVQVPSLLHTVHAGEGVPTVLLRSAMGLAVVSVKSRR